MGNIKCLDNSNCFIVTGEELKNLNIGLYNAVEVGEFIDITRRFYVSVQIHPDGTINYYVGNDRDMVVERCIKDDIPDTMDLVGEVSTDYIKECYRRANS